MNSIKKNVIIASSLILTVVYLLTASPSMAADPTWKKLIDYGNEGYSETSNNWNTYGAGGVNGTFRYLSHEVGDGTRTGTATWKTTVPYCGIYRVSVSFRRTENRTADADYFVTNKSGGEDHYVIDQRGHLTYPSWGLGQVDYYYSAGQEVKVVLDGTDDGASDCADAAQWELLQWQECPLTPEELATRAGTGASRSLLLSN